MKCSPVLPLEALLLTGAGWSEVSRFLEGEPEASYSGDTVVSDASSSCQGGLGAGVGVGHDLLSSLGQKVPNNCKTHSD